LKASGVIYRLGRKPDPWSPPDWASAGPDATFGNRFDDPDATYRVLYASSQRLGCFVETLARFRVDPKLLAELAQIEGEDDHCPAALHTVTNRTLFAISKEEFRYTSNGALPLIQPDAGPKK
jgi:hypothetical protein